MIYTIISGWGLYVASAHQMRSYRESKTKANVINNRENDRKKRTATSKHKQVNEAVDLCLIACLTWVVIQGT